MSHFEHNLWFSILLSCTFQPKFQIPFKFWPKFCTVIWNRIFMFHWCRDFFCTGRLLIFLFLTALPWLIIVFVLLLVIFLKYCWLTAELPGFWPLLPQDGRLIVFVFVFVLLPIHLVIVTKWGHSFFKG